MSHHVRRGLGATGTAGCRQHRCLVHVRSLKHMSKECSWICQIFLCCCLKPNGWGQCTFCTHSPCGPILCTHLGNPQDAVKACHIEHFGPCCFQCSSGIALQCCSLVASTLHHHTAIACGHALPLGSSWLEMATHSN